MDISALSTPGRLSRKRQQTGDGAASDQPTNQPTNQPNPSTNTTTTTPQTPAETPAAQLLKPHTREKKTGLIAEYLKEWQWSFANLLSA